MQFFVQSFRQYKIRTGYNYSQIFIIGSEYEISLAAKIITFVVNHRSCICINKIIMFVTRYLMISVGGETCDLEVHVY